MAVKAQIFNTIPDSLLIEVRKLTTTKDVWDFVCARHEGKGIMVNVDLCHQMQELKCKEDTDVHMHLEAMMMMYEELSGMGGTPDPKEYLTILLGSLPKSYRVLLMPITVAASIAGKDLNPEDIVVCVNEEFNLCLIKVKLIKANKNALAANSHRKGKCNKGQDKKGSKDKIECWGCGKLGHTRAKWKDKSKGKSKEGKSDK